MNIQPALNEEGLKKDQYSFIDLICSKCDKILASSTQALTIYDMIKEGNMKPTKNLASKWVYGEKIKCVCGNMNILYRVNATIGLGGLLILQCKRCLHKWIPRKMVRANRCPQCNTCIRCEINHRKKECEKKNGFQEM